jgi:hypothetical protein
MQMNAVFAKVASLPDRVALDDLQAQQDDRSANARSLHRAREQRDVTRAELAKVREHRSAVEEDLERLEIESQPPPPYRSGPGETDLKEMKVRATAKIAELEALLGRIRSQLGGVLRRLDSEDRRVSQRVDVAKQVQEDRQNAIGGGL